MLIYNGTDSLFAMNPAELITLILSVSIMQSIISSHTNIPFKH